MAKKKSNNKSGKSKKSTSKFVKKLIIVSFILIFVIGGGTAYYSYTRIYKPNVITSSSENTYFFIKTGSNFEDVLTALTDSHLIRNMSSFKWVAERKGYINKVKPGRYKLKPNMNNNDLVNLLRSGEQEPVNLVFNEARTKEDFVEIIHKQIEADPEELIKLLNNNDFLKQYEVNNKNVLTLFIPNTYQIYWNTSASQFINKMFKEYQRFWNNNRIAKANKLGLSKAEVGILASIVQQESKIKDEQPVIAAVYYNRLKKRMLLQADPTVIYAIGDFNIRRVLSKHLSFDSPYNTYKYLGLPPGPICIPLGSTIDAVLNQPKHNYLYFCAKEDFSGRHNFASNLIEHQRNANAFRNALNKRKIFQ